MAIKSKHSGLNIFLPDFVFRLKPAGLNDEFKAGRRENKLVCLDGGSKFSVVAEIVNPLLVGTAQEVTMSLACESTEARRKERILRVFLTPPRLFDTTTGAFRTKTQTCILLNLIHLNLTSLHYRIRSKAPQNQRIKRELYYLFVVCLTTIEVSLKFGGLIVCLETKRDSDSQFLFFSKESVIFNSNLTNIVVSSQQMSLHSFFTSDHPSSPTFRERASAPPDTRPSGVTELFQHTGNTANTDFSGELTYGRNTSQGNQDQGQHTVFRSVPLIQLNDHQPGQGNRTSYCQENLIGEGLCHDWNPATEVILQNHIRLRQVFLKAYQTSSSVPQGEGGVQLRGERLIGRERLLSITEGWNPHAERPGQTQPDRDDVAEREMASKRGGANRAGGAPGVRRLRSGGPEEQGGRRGGQIGAVLQGM
ncbi:hypothetical protein VP01_625g1 [Puccinia sorghi]|uniref:Uncharacterized protein n=1 Tax=Puccinia sorghi TaxID=27349 RepID=A0A0L6UGG5_9BASI|nr:hypothetical protein VP01_625g1 [Puccinia sorghi]